MAELPSVSVVVPAYEAAATLGDALGSLRAQTHGGWEAVVVDDGSADATAAVAEEHARADPRIRVLRLAANGGVAAARNAGLAEARHDWLLFLDADDLLEPHALEVLATTAAEGHADVLHGGWLTVTADGSTREQRCREDGADLFALHCRTCGVALHATLVRRSLVERAGGFDPALVICEDWDLWQRVARLGARWRQVPQTVAVYRVRPDSASMAAAAMLRDGATVITRGHGPDVRLAGLEQRHPDGAPASRLPGALVEYVAYVAGLCLGAGQDPADLLDHLPLLAARPSGDLVAAGLLEAVALGRATSSSPTPVFTPEVVRAVDALVDALEPRVGQGFARQLRRGMDRYLAGRNGWDGRPRFGAVEIVDVDLGAPPADIRPAAGVEELHVRARYGDLRLAPIPVPVIDGLVPGALIADAVATAHAWPLLGEHLARAVLPSLSVERSDGRLTVRRGGVTLTDAAPAPDADARQVVHDHAGWALLLQELWDDPAAGEDRFYDPRARPASATPRGTARDGWWAFEVSAPLGDVATDGDRLLAVPTVGGVALGAFPVEVRRGVASAGAIRAAVCWGAGAELSRSTVREGVIGIPADDPRPLAQRLRERAARAASSAPAAVSGPAAAPGWQEAARRALGRGGSGTVLGRPRGAPTGSPAARLMALPAAARGAVVSSATVAGEPVVEVGGAEAAPGRVVVAPGVLWEPEPPLPEERLPAGPRPVRGGPAARLRERLRRPVDAAPVVTERLPILGYHRVTPGGDRVMRDRCVTPEAFDRQLGHLRAAGFTGATFDEWHAAVRRRMPLPGRRVLLTFDGGYRDFADHAAPILQRHGFRATVFVVSGHVGGRSLWDAPLTEPAELMDWPTLRALHERGFEVGGHTATHPMLTRCDAARVAEEASRCRAALTEALGSPPAAFAYPLGDHDAITTALVAACGWRFGVTARDTTAARTDDPMALPRLKVDGTADLAAFVRALR